MGLVGLDGLSRRFFGFVDLFGSWDLKGRAFRSRGGRADRRCGRLHVARLLKQHALRMGVETGMHEKCPSVTKVGFGSI